MAIDYGVGHHLRKALEDLHEDSSSSRAKALVQTKIEEALLWLRYESENG